MGKVPGREEVKTLRWVFNDRVQGVGGGREYPVSTTFPVGGPETE